MRCTPAVSARLRALRADGPTFGERIALLLDRLDYWPIAGAEETRSVQEMRYRAYRREGAAPANVGGRLDDGFDRAPNARTFALGWKGHICASVRLHVVTSAFDPSPAISNFPDALVPLLETGERLIDPNCFCVDPLLSGAIPELAYLTLRLPFIAAGLRPRSSVTATVRAEHHAFYRRVLRCSAVAPPRAYEGRSKPLGLMLVSYDREADNVVARYPFFAERPGEAATIGLDRIGAHDFAPVAA